MCERGNRLDKRKVFTGGPATIFQLILTNSE